MKCKAYLENFHKSFVLVPADKASNNILIVCKKYYLNVVITELSGSNSKQSTYVSSVVAVDKLIEDHKKILHDCNICIKSDMEQLPTLYWLPKMPIGSSSI